MDEDSKMVPLPPLEMQEFFQRLDDVAEAMENDETIEEPATLEVWIERLTERLITD